MANREGEMKVVAYYKVFFEETISLQVFRLSQRCRRDNRSSGMCRRVTKWLVSDVSRECGGLIFKGRNGHEEIFTDISTLEDETTTLSRNVRPHSPSDAATHPGGMGTSTRIICLLIHGLFNNAVNSADYTAPKQESFCDWLNNSLLLTLFQMKSYIASNEWQNDHKR
jgi:hypothetical protein